jgi:hypothetical protein
MKLKNKKPTNKSSTGVKRLGSVIALLLALGVNKLFAFDPHWADIVDTDFSDISYHRYLLDEKGLGIGTRILAVNASPLGLILRPLLQKGGAVLYDRDSQYLEMSFHDTIQIKLPNGRIVDMSDVMDKKDLDKYFPAWVEYQRRQNTGR